MSTEIKPGQVWTWYPEERQSSDQFEIVSLDRDMATYRYLPNGKRTYNAPKPLIREKAHLVPPDATPAPLDPATCAHGTTAEDLCNAMPAKVELDAMWAAWKSLTPAEQRGWLEGGEGKVPTPAKVQLATALMPLHDAPDIENVPAASSMHTLMGAVAEIQHGVRQIVESMSPEATAERARVIAPLAMELARQLEEPAPSLPTQDGDDDGREAAPLDPSLARGLAQSAAGDVVDLGDFTQYAPLDASNEKADALDLISRGFAALAKAVRDGS